MAIILKEPDYAGAARGNIHLDTALRSVFDALKQIHEKIALQATEPGKGVIGPAPPQVTFSAVGGTGTIEVQITNPKRPANLSNALIYHAIEYSTDATFATGVKRIQPTPQTHLVIPVSSGTYHVRVRSSYDGVNWGQWQQ